jgi:hypothetical protein
MAPFSSKKRVKPLPHDKPLDLRIPVVSIYFIQYYRIQSLQCTLLNNNDLGLLTNLYQGYGVGPFKPISRKDNATDTTLSNERISRSICKIHHLLAQLPHPSQ